jgi:hypothetical protein
MTESKSAASLLFLQFREPADGACTLSRTSCAVGPEDFSTLIQNL